MGKNHIEGRLYSTSDNFDKEASTELVNNLRHFGYSRFYTQAAESSSNPALEGTDYSDGHYNHLHGDAEDQGGTIPTSKYVPAIQKQSSESIQIRQEVNKSSVIEPTNAPKQEMGFWENLKYEFNKGVNDIQHWHW
jgi:hypothetical protein